MPGVGKGWTQTALTLGSLRMKANEDCMEVATPDGGSPMVPVTPTEEEERQARVRTRRALFQDGQEPTVESLSEQLHDVIAHCQQLQEALYAGQNAQVMMKMMMNHLMQSHGQMRVQNQALLRLLQEVKAANLQQRKGLLRTENELIDVLYEQKRLLHAARNRSQQKFGRGQKWN